MDFTREPIIETIITPKEGCKLVVRSSKSAGQEEYFVDAVEVVAFGNALFFRSIERPKTFLVPASDYEVLEVREARMVLKNVGMDRTVKIGGNKEQAPRLPKEPIEPPVIVSEASPQANDESPEALDAKMSRLDKRREKRRHNRRRRGRDEGTPTEEQPAGSSAVDSDQDFGSESENAAPAEKNSGAAPSFSSLLPPPPTLISETIARYRDNALFKDAFFSKEEVAAGESTFNETESAETLLSKGAEESGEALEMRQTTLEPSAFGSFDTFGEEREHSGFSSEKANDHTESMPQEESKKTTE